MDTILRTYASSLKHQIAPSAGSKAPFAKFVMQLLIAGGVFGLLAPVAFAATVTSTATGGNWNTGSTWVGGTVPATGDTAVIATTGGNSVTITANATIANLTVNSGSILAFSGTQTLTFGTAGGVATVNGTVNGSGTLVMNKNPIVLAGVGTINSSISAAQPTSVSASSNLTVNGIITVGNTFTINSGATLNASTINSNGKTVANNGTVNLSGNYARTGGTAIWTQGTNAVLNIGGIFTPSASVTLNATASGNTVNYNGSAQAIEPASYVNLTLSGSGAASLVTGTSVSGTMNIAQTGTATASIGAGLTLTVANLTLGGLGRINGTWGSTSSTATYQNNTYFAATTGKLSVTNDTRATPTISVSNSPVTYSGVAQAATVTGSVSGSVSSILYNGSGTMPTNAGTYAITANFVPTDGTSYKSLTGASAGNFVINQATTTISVSTSGTPTIYGTTVTFTATVAPQNGGAPSGTVTFKDGGTVIGTGTLGGGNPDTATFATAALSAGAHSITAVYAGDSNYVTSMSGSISQSVTQKALTVSGLTASNKIYDQGNTAAITGTPTLVGVVGGDSVSLTGTAAGTFASVNVGTGISVSVSGLSLTGAQAGNYTLTEPTLSANITQKPLTVSGVTASNKTYDGNTTATLNTSIAALVGVISGDTVTLNAGSAVGTFTSSSVGTGIVVTVSGLSLTGAQAGNYSLTEPTTTANITQKNLTVSGITANNKEYDGNTTATLSGTGSLVGVVSGDTVSLGGTAVGTFASSNIGTGIVVTVSGLSLTGAQAGNYTLTQPTLSADITGKSLTVTGITASNKTYDGNTTATLNVGSAALVGVASGDTVTLNTGSATGAFSDTSVGAGKTVTVSGLTISGAQAGNYTLTEPTTTASITGKNLTISGLTANNKMYDGTTAATLSGTGSLVGVVSGDTVSLGGTAVGTFASPNVGTGISVSVSGLSLTGAQAGNYTLTEPTLSADILNAGPTITSISPSSKNVGDAGFTLTVNGSNFIASSTVNFNGSPRTTTFASSTQLTAAILSSDLTVATSSALITVTNPAPGGGTSSAISFSVIALNTAPTISSITPSSVSAGSPDTVVTIVGSDFLASSTVQFNSVDLATTTFASSTQMTATIPAAHLAATSTNTITVTNPAPGGGTSSAQTFSVVTAADTTAPTVTAFSLPATSSVLTISISSFSATDNVGVTGYMITESSTTPSVSDSAWSATAPSSYTFTLQGDKTLYAWAKDAAGNISAGVSATTSITYVQVSPGGEQTLLTNGTMSPNNTATSSSNVTFRQAVHIVFGNGSTIVIPLSTVMTASTTSDWTTLLSTNSVSTTDIPSSVTSAGALQWGLPSTAITTSQPVTVEIYVGAAFNGRSLSYYRKEAGGTSWTQAGTCTISSGLCQFTTSTFCSFFVGVPVTTTTTTGGGVGSTVPPTTVTLDGVAFPGASVSVIDKDSPYQTIFTKNVTTGSDSTFHISFVGVLMSQHSYGLIIRDSQGRLSQSKFFNIDTVTHSLTVKDIVVSPTIGFLQTAVARGNPVSIVGFSTPGSIVHVSIDGTMQKDVTAGSDGSYRLSADTGALDFGGHQVRASQTNKAGVTSDFSPTQVFTVAQTSNVSTDLNGDGVTDIRDMSIFLSRWQSTDPAVLKTIDFNSDGKADLTDFSILLRAIRKQ